MSTYEQVQLGFVVVIAVLFGLPALARRYPDIRALEFFRVAFPTMSPQQQAQARRQSDLLEGIKFILLGLILPLIYIFGTVMMFNDITIRGLSLFLAGSFICIAIGIRAIQQSRRG